MDLIVIIDSGIDETESLMGNIVGGVTIVKKDSKYMIEDGNYKDLLGHGTAIFNMIYKECPNNMYYIIKIFDNDFECDASLVEVALEYVSSNFESPIVLIPSGAMEIENRLKVESLVTQITEKGGIVISAFNNQGGISYPAAFDAVVGVDSSAALIGNRQCFFIKGSPINVIMREKSYRVKWLHSKTVIEKGNSYAAAEFTAILVNARAKHKTSSISELLALMSGNEFTEYLCYDFDTMLHPISKIHHIHQKPIKAIMFPFSKEMQTLAANEDLLSVDVLDYFDVRQSGKVGLKIRDILTFCENEKTIHNIEKLDWDNYDFDLLVCGHLDRLNSITGKNITKELLSKCIKHKKLIYSFDNVKTHYNEHYSIPLIKTYTGNTFGKTWNIESLVVGVYGTSAMQGKFSFQLSLRRTLLSKGFHVAQISTEPTGTLFGMDYTCPIGYNGSVQTFGYNTALFFNEIVHRCDMKDPDVILTGCQSGTIPFSLLSKDYYTFVQYEFLVGTNPDAVVLMVNHFDEIGYIKRTIQFIESSIDTVVIACVISPIVSNKSLGFSDAAELSSIINKPVWSYYEASERVVEQLINSFGGEK